MGVFKGLSRSEVFLTDYNSQKKWNVSGSNLGDFGIQYMRAYSGSTMFSNTLYQNYYSGSLQDGSFQGSSDFYRQTTLSVPGTRHLPEIPYSPEPTASVIVMAFPLNLTGTHLEEGSISLGPKQDGVNYVEDDYTVLETDLKDPYYFENLRLQDCWDKEGALYMKGYGGEYKYQEGFEYPVPDTDSKKKPIGDVIYSHGLVIITDPFWATMFRPFGGKQTGILERVSWTSNVPIYTYNIGCSVKDHEFNFSYNPTAKHLNGDKDFTPYITSVGLYNRSGEMVAVAKLSKPIRKLDNIDMTFNVRIDIS